MFFSLPPRLQLVLAEVHKTPFTDSRLLPDPIWESDRDYLIQTHAVQNQVQYGSAEVRFTVTTNTLWGSHLAFRTRQDLVDSHVDGVAVGDSFTFCFTNLSDCWVQQLGQMTKRNLINLGITSTGATSHDRVLINFGLPLQPALVLWQWFGNDANEDYGLAQLNGETDITSPVPPPPIPNRSWWDDNSALYTLLKLYLGPADEYDATLQFHAPYYAQKGDVKLSFGEPYLLNAFDMSQPHNQYGWTRSQEAMLDARDRVEAYGGTILFILMPTKEQVYRDMAAPLLGPEKMAMLDGPYTLMQDFCAQEHSELPRPAADLPGARAGGRAGVLHDRHAHQPARQRDPGGYAGRVAGRAPRRFPRLNRFLFYEPFASVSDTIGHMGRMSMSRPSRLPCA